MQKVIASAVLVLAASACVDAKKKFDEFDDRAGRMDGGGMTGGGGIYDVTGTFLLGADPVFVPGSDTSQIVQFIATATLTRTGDTATLGLSIQPLRVNGEPYRATVGSPLVASDVPVAADGTFRLQATGTLPGEANPVSGTPQALVAILEGTLKSADLFCGPLSGSVGGVDMSGSTFGAIRVTNTAPPTLPMPIGGCPAEQPTDAGVDAPDVDAGVDAPPDAPTDAPPDAP